MSRHLSRSAAAAAALALLAAGCAADPPSSVVGLTVTGCPPEIAHGTGIVIAPGLVLTAAHVLKGADTITVDNGRHTGSGAIVAFDPEMDLALVAVDAAYGTPVATDVLDGSAPAPRERVARGTPGTAYVFRDGAALTLPVELRRPVEITTEDIYVDGETLRQGYEISAAIRAGDSGGPVFVGGELVGVIWARSNLAEQRAYAIDPVASGATIRHQVATGTIDPSIDLARCY